MLLRTEKINNFIFNFFLCVFSLLSQSHHRLSRWNEITMSDATMTESERKILLFFILEIKQFSNDWLSENDILENYNSRRPAEIKERTKIRAEPLPETWKLLFHQSLPANIPRDFHHVILARITTHLSSSRFVEVRSNHSHTQPPRHEEWNEKCLSI